MIVKLLFPLFSVAHVMRPIRGLERCFTSLVQRCPTQTLATGFHRFLARFSGEYDTCLSGCRLVNHCTAQPSACESICRLHTIIHLFLDISLYRVWYKFFFLIRKFSFKETRYTEADWI